MRKAQGDNTISAVANASANPQTTVRAWADKGLLPCRRDSAGRRLFPDSAIPAAIRLREAKEAHTVRRNTSV